MAVALLLSSCSASLPTQREVPGAESGAMAVSYSIVCVIHGDGDYLYHDTTGVEYRADEEALAGALRVAEQNPNGEVFIFHQQPRRHFLFLFPLPDGEFHYYRNGRLVTKESYWRDQDSTHFSAEAGLYRSCRAENRRGVTGVFVYCGQEIPEFGGAGYDRSYPDRPFTVHDFADGMKGFTDDSSRFDLLVLSSCFGGTPYTIGALGSSARYIIASPDNLHLSYFDLKALERLDVGLGEGDMFAFAVRYAQKSFERLTESVQTAVSVAVYDVDRVQGFLSSVEGVYEGMVAAGQAETRAFSATLEHCDCAEIARYVQPTMGDGVEVFYRPARFGRLKDKQDHSGWECWRERRSGPAAPQTAGAGLAE